MVPAKRAPVSRPAPKLGEYRELIDEWLLADREAPRKQRHTAKRVWRRLVDEHGVDVAETTVRDLVRRRRRELGLSVAEVFVPQVHAAARTAEVDWGQAEVCLAGVATTVHLFFMRSCFSGAAFAMASPVETQQAFLEGHAQAFGWFGGVFAELRYDNLTSAVKQVLKGRRRVESDRFVAMRSHYLFESIFTTPGIGGAPGARRRPHRCGFRNPEGDESLRWAARVVGARVVAFLASHPGRAAHGSLRWRSRWRSRLAQPLAQPLALPDAQPPPGLQQPR